MGERPEVAAERGGKECSWPCWPHADDGDRLFPVVFLYGVSKFLFTALALAVVLSLFASICGHDRGAAVLRQADSRIKKKRSRTTRTWPPHGWLPRFNRWFNHKFNRMLDRYEGTLNLGLMRPVATCWASPVFSC